MTQQAGAVFVNITRVHCWVCVWELETSFLCFGKYTSCCVWVCVCSCSLLTRLTDLWCWLCNDTAALHCYCLSVVSPQAKGGCNETHPFNPLWIPCYSFFFFISSPPSCRVSSLQPSGVTGSGLVAERKLKSRVNLLVVLLSCADSRFWAPTKQHTHTGPIRRGFRDILCTVPIACKEYNNK